MLCQTPSKIRGLINKFAAILKELIRNLSRLARVDCEGCLGPTLFAISQLSAPLGTMIST